MARTLLLDGDITAYQFAAMAEQAVHWGDGRWTLHADEEEATGKMLEHVDTIIERLEADALVVALSDPDNNFRKDVLPSYKENRVNQRKPMILMELKDALAAEFKTYMKPGLEGDDVLGILATHPTIIKGEKVIVSIDKDMRTIPCKCVNLSHTADALYAKEIEFWTDGITEVTEFEADLFHMMQALAGDPTDGYKGCPGVGMESARKALQLVSVPGHGSCFAPLVEEEYTPTRGKYAGTTTTRWLSAPDPDATMWDVVVSYYAKAGFGEEEALVQARCARILRANDYDFKKKEPILWTP